MKFWDSSAVVPLLVPEVMSGSMQRLYESDPVMVAWWATEIECTSAIAGRQHLGQLWEDIEFVSLDDRLLAAARREGFSTTKPVP